MPKRPSRPQTPPRSVLPNFLSGTALCLLLIFLWSGPAAAVFGDGAVTQDTPVLKEIRIAGNEKTNTDLILREMNLKIGRPLTREAVDRVWDHLEDLGHFAYVDMEYEEQEDGVVLLVTVEEDLSTGYGPSLRFSQRHKYLLGAWLEDTNLRGNGEILRLEASALYIQRATASWTRPWFLGQRGLRARLALRAEQADYVYRPFRYRKGIANGSVRWRFRKPFFADVGVGWGVNEVRDAYVWPAPDRGSDAPPKMISHQPKTTTRWTWHAAVGLDTRTNPWYPSRGAYLCAQTRLWTSSHFDSYLQNSLDARLYLPLPGRVHLLALRAWGRTTDGPAQLNNVLFVGGAKDLRGHSLRAIEGDKGYLLSAEYRLPLFMMRISPKGELAGFGLHAFADAGDAWYYGAEAHRARQDWGAGLHVNLDRLQLRFEAARTDEGDWSFEFRDIFNF